MKIEDVLDNLADLLSTNSEITSLCMSLYGRSPKIFIGYNFASPPEKDKMPAIIFSKIDVYRDYNFIRYKINIGIVVEDGTIDTTKTSIIKYSGFYNCEKLKDLIERVIKLHKPNLGKYTFSGESMQGVVFPVHGSILKLDIEIPITGRGKNV